MKRRVIIKESFSLLRSWSFLLLAPILVAIIYKEYTSIPIFLALFANIYLISTVITKKIDTKEQAQLKEGFTIIAFCWLIVTLIGGLVFYFHLPISFLDAFFESMSSWTTTGLSVLTPESLPHTILFWRSFGQWIGGLGIVILVAGNIFKNGNAILKAEGRNDRIKPNIINSLRIMGGIYVAYTMIGMLSLWLAGMGLFDAVNHAMTAIATGGMSTKNASIMAFEGLGIRITLIIMMILGNISFFHHYHLLKGDVKTFFKSKQNLILFSIITIGTLLLLLPHTFMESLFQIVSAIGTGYNTVNITTWGNSSIMILLLLMMLGGVAGSTAGGIKIHRLGIVLQQINIQIKKMKRPHQIFVNKFDDKNYQQNEVIRIYNYIFIYIVILVVATMIFAGLGHDPLKALFEIASAQGNVGLSMDITYGGLEKAILIFVMWAGRLEIWAVLISLLHFISGGHEK